MSHNPDFDPSFPVSDPRVQRDGASWSRSGVPWPGGTSARFYDLGHTMHPGMPHHPNHPPFSYVLTKQHGDIMYREGVSASSEMITLGGHVGTHIDALSHVSKDGMVAGCHSIMGDNQSYTGGMGVHPIDAMPPIFAQGHLLDAQTLLGRPLTGDDGIDAEHFDEWFAGRPSPAPGSVVLVRTGWDLLWNDIGKYLGVETGVPGVTLSGAKWLSERGVQATGSDTVAYEKYPPFGQLAMEVHVHLLIEAGVPIVEALHLESLSRDQHWEFLFIAVPMKLRGGTGSPLRPLAVVGG